jgi:hypothetical protein
VAALQTGDSNVKNRQRLPENQPGDPSKLLKSDLLTIISSDQDK